MEGQQGDVYIVGFQCSGCEWLKGIVEKLQHKRSQHICPVNGHQSLLRTLNCVEIFPEQLPLQPDSYHQTSCKYIILLRHPKDVVIARLLRNGLDPSRHLQEFLQNIYPDEQPSWFTHTLKWAQYFSSFNEQQVHLVLYKDLSQNLDNEVNKMASFLGLSLTTDFCQNLDLESVLSPEEPKRKRQRTDNTENHLNFNSVEYENGIWKKFFTMAQSEAFDAHIAHKLQNIGHDSNVVQWIQLAMQ